MDSLVERLRAMKFENIPYGSWKEPQRTDPVNPDGPEAADLIESQQATINQLVEAMAVVLDGDQSGNFQFMVAGNPNAADAFLDGLRALLSKLKESRHG